MLCAFQLPHLASITSLNASNVPLTPPGPIFLYVTNSISLFFRKTSLTWWSPSLVSVTTCLLLYYILYWGQSLGNVASLWRLGKGALSGQIRPEVHQSTWLWGQRTDQAQPFFPISFVPLCSEPCTEPDEVALTQSLLPQPDHTWGRDFVWTPPSKSF